MITEFFSPTRVLFGPGALSHTAKIARELGTNALVVTGADTRRAEGLIDMLRKQGLAATLFSAPREPAVSHIEAGVRSARETGCNLVVGFGGGSPIDAGKAIAALITNPGAIETYLEVVGEGRAIEKLAAPYIAIPTTSGTGAEVTRNAVLKVESRKVKVSMRSPLMLPSVAIVDPLTTCSMPKAITAATGLDALTQVIEPFVSRQAGPITDAVCRDGMRLAARSLKAAFDNGDDVEARADMCLASLFGGIALANAKLGAVHGFAGPIGGMFDAPHGLICGLLLQRVMAANVEALTERAPGSALLAKFDQVAQILTGNPGATAPDGVAWIAALSDHLGLPTLASVGITTNHLPEIVAKAKHASSMKGNPLPLNDDALLEILTLSL